MNKKKIYYILAVLLFAAAGIVYFVTGTGRKTEDNIIIDNIELATDCDRDIFLTADSGTDGEQQMECSAQKNESLQESSQMVLLVYVCGYVVNPGVYEFKEGDRMCQAIEAAGGFCDDACPDMLNLAEPVFDGEKIYVPSKTEMTISFENGQVGLGGTFDNISDGKVDINTASKEELMTLNGIGESRAEAIIVYRKEHGKFGSIEDIMNVTGIKNAAFDKIKDEITVR